MRRFLLCAIMALAFAVPASADSFTVLRDNILKNTVQINGNCSGTLIYSDRDKKTGDVTSIVLTAKHCIGNKNREQFIDFPVYQNNRVVKRERYTATVRGQSWKSDLALFELKDTATFFEGTAAVAGDDVDIAMGDRVYTAGYPMGLSLTITEGLFASAETIDFPKDGTEYYRATPDVIGGNSGGAMYHETDGVFELIGVTTLAARGAPYMGFYTPAEEIYEYLKSALPDAVGAAPKTKIGVSK